MSWEISLSDVNQSKASVAQKAYWILAVNRPYWIFSLIFLWPRIFDGTQLPSLFRRYPSRSPNFWRFVCLWRSLDIDSMFSSSGPELAWGGWGEKGLYSRLPSRIRKPKNVWKAPHRAFRDLDKAKRDGD